MLEAEIKRLSDNIEHLNKLLEVMADTAKVNTTTNPAPKPAPTQSDATNGAGGVKTGGHFYDSSYYSHDDLKAMALTIAKKDRARSKDIKAKLGEHDAKVMTDLAGDDMRAVGEWLTNLKQEVGA